MDGEEGRHISAQSLGRSETLSREQWQSSLLSPSALNTLLERERELAMAMAVVSTFL